MRIACILITRLCAKAELRRRERLRGKPFAVMDRAANAMRPPVIDSSPEASGVATGMTLSQALSVHNDLIVLDSDGAYYNAVFDDAVRALQTVSDRVQPEELGIAHVRIDGLADLYGGEIQTARALLAPLSASLLPVSDKAKRKLRLFCLHRIKDIAAMTQSAMNERFGAEGKQAWELANGIDHRPVLPAKIPEPVQERIELPYAATTSDVLLVGIETLLRRAYANPRMRERRASAMVAHGLAAGATAWERTFHFKRPPSDWQAAFENVRERLISNPPAPAAPLDELALSLTETAAESGYQVDMLDAKRADKRRRLADAARHISLRSAADPIVKVSQIAPWHPLPEMRAVKTPLDASADVAMLSLNAPEPALVRAELNGMPSDALAQGKRASWRRVKRIDNLWEIDLWWLPQPTRRRYFDAIDERGAKLTLFKDETDGAWHLQTA